MRNHFRFVLSILFLALGVSVARAGSYEDFFRAIKRDDPATVTELLQRGFDPNTLDPAGRPGLFIAVQEGSLKAAEALVALAQDQGGMAQPKDESPLMMAALGATRNWCAS